MERIVDGMIAMEVVGVFILPLCLMAAFFENTRIGRRIMDRVMKKMGVEEEELDG